jgi:hypothetical protein
MNKQLIAVIAAGLIAGGVLAQEGKQPTAPPPAPAEKEKQPAEKSPAPHAPLAGPQVPDRTGKPTLVEHGLDGKVKRLDEWPALVAARKLPLDEKAKAAIAKLNAEQAAAMDKMMSESLPEIAVIASAFQSGDTAEGVAGIRKLKQNHPVLEERERLAQRIAALLDKEQGHEVSIMVQEYWNALIQEQTDAAKTRGEKGGAGKIAGAEALRLLGQDIKASYDRVIGQQVRDFDALIKTLGLTAEQESKVRKITDDAFAKANGNQAKVDKSAVFWKIWRELDSRQRALLIEQFKGKGKKTA